MSRKDPAAEREYQRAYRAANRERLAAQRKARREADIVASRARERERRLPKRASINAAARAYRAANPDKIRAANKAYLDRPGNRERVRLQRRRAQHWNKYGLTAADLDALVLRCEGRCELCGEQLGPARKPVIDHCHDSGTVRGLLCGACNVALGKLGDNEPGLLRALQYVRGERRLAKLLAA